MSDNLTERFKEQLNGFSKLSRKERYDRLVNLGALKKEDVKCLSGADPISLNLAEKFIENVIGYYQMPMGVATHFVINKKPYVIPMAVEETSIIAAASKTAKRVRDHGELVFSVEGDQVIGQLQIAKVKNLEVLRTVIKESKEALIEELNNEVAFGLVRRGGGVKNITLRELKRPDGLVMAVIHVYVNTCEAMGANIVNQIVEYLKNPIEELSEEKVDMCILSNLVDTKITRAKLVLRDVSEEEGRKIEEASLFAQLDPYRAATNNKGVLNGVDPILIATGNDWRAVNAGVHAYAAKQGQYSSVTKWKYESGKLTGLLEAPIILGTVGGVTRLHPMAQMSLTMMGIESSNELSGVCACVGLIQNLGALQALTTVGIIEGHMKLHIKNLTLGAGAKEDEMPIMYKKLEEILKFKKRISLSHAVDALRELRDKKQASEIKENTL